MKKIIIIIGFLLLGTGLHAQITPLQEAVDFTVTDVQGNQIHLFDVLDGGQAVFIHFFLTYNFDPPMMPFMTEAIHYPNGIYLLRNRFGKAHRFIVSH